MRFAIPLFVAMILACSPVVCVAGAMDTMARASSEYSSGNYVESINLLKKSIEEIWNEAPLTAQNVNFIEEPSMDFGVFTPRENDIFEAVEPIILYCETIGYTAKKSGGKNFFSMNADYSLVDNNGKVLSEKKNFKSWEAKSRAFITENFWQFTFNFRGLPPGKYHVHVTLHDLNSTKSTVIKKPFIIRQ